MELQDFQRFKTEFHGLPITIDLDVITPGFLRLAANRLREEFQKAIAEQEQTAESANQTPESESPDTTKTQTNLEVEMVARSLENTARALEIERDVCAYLLAGTENPILIEWELTDKGQPVPCTEAELRKRNPRMIKALYKFCLSAGDPKKTTETQ